MRKRAFNSTVAALGLFSVVGLVAALAPSIAWPNLARAHSPGSATLTALTVTVDGTAQTLSPTFSSTVTDYTVAVANTVTQITVEATPDGDGTVAYQNTDGTTLTDADPGTDGQQVDLPAGDDKPINVVVTHTDGGTTTTQTYTVLVSREGTGDPCAGGGYNPSPTTVAVTTVPIVVTSTTDDYFVLYVSHEVDGTDMDLPVLVKKGEAGTTTLAENVEALPKERYRVEKYLIADPADVDGDCVDDITELNSLGSMNPVNPAAAIASSDGTVAIPDRDTLETLSYFYNDGKSYLKFILLGWDTDTPRVYFMNTGTHPVHQSFLDAVGLEQGNVIVGSMVYDPQLIAPDGSQGSYYFWLEGGLPSFSLESRSYTLLAACMPLLEDNLALHISNFILPAYEHELPLFEASRINVLFEDNRDPEASFLALKPGGGVRPVAGPGAGRLSPPPQHRDLRGAAQRSAPRGRHHLRRAPNPALARQPARRAERHPQRLHPRHPR